MVQSLMDAAVRTHQQQRQEDGDASSFGSLESLSSDKPDKSEDAKKRKGKRLSKAATDRENAMQDRISQYREGKLNLPPHEVIQNSFHFKTGKVDLQLCDDTSSCGTVQGSMLIQVREGGGRGGGERGGG
jgi:hypothetical protein